jgi:hypothetical protein
MGGSSTSAGAVAEGLEKGVSAVPQSAPVLNFHG